MSDPQTPAPTQRFQQIYQSTPPWEVGYLQPAVKSFLDSGIIGPVLDIGCGTGQACLELAKRGFQVTGIDLVPQAIAAAKTLLQQHGLESQVDLQVGDATKLATWSPPGQFNTIIDAALFHVFPPTTRISYIAGLSHVAAPGAQLCVICFSDQEPGDHGPLRITRQQLLQDFGLPAAFCDQELLDHNDPNSNWQFKSLQPVRYFLREDASPKFSPKGAHAWRLILSRQHAYHQHTQVPPISES